MKRFLSLFLLANVIALAGFANHDDGIVSITNFSRFGVRVMVDGRIYAGRNNSIVIPDLCPGYHTVKVFRFDPRFAGPFGSGGNELIFSNTIYVKPRSEVSIVVHRRGRVSVEESRMRGRDNRYYDDDRYNKRDDRNRDYDDRWRDDYRR
jgi:hypothetical protein